MPNERDDTRLATPSQLLFDVLTHIEQLRRTLADTEAMTHGANATLARLPYMPWPEQPTLGHSSAANPEDVPSHVESAPAIDAGAREYALEQRLDVGRLNTYVIASATSMRDAMAECDRLIAHTRRRIEEVRGMRMVPDDTPEPGPRGPAGAATAGRNDKLDTPVPTGDEDSTPETSSSQVIEVPATSLEVRAAMTDRMPRCLDPAKVIRAARAAARRPTTPKPDRAASADAPEPVSFLGGGLDRGGRRWPGARPRSSAVAQAPARGVLAVVTVRNCPARR
ncbi:hypothetical protein [Haliangium sp.]|uniref:hypothetical protein n=1 Tax=Haliangium sp. TaxID=2663208 RepID=UPI003D0F0FDB